ncbi:hypothetical protein RB195_020162 [Necator americanus]|uniref:Uncharacterized protein n=2 Tax=Necator americanus TaxID=51031 RepID=A0ABR1CHK2_NECAM|nr:hypothetical protein NECAME_08181 [Necator americanus]ETN82082.1 hypothetical protein NECAME_08181 [Necator americanus]
MGVTRRSDLLRPIKVDEDEEGVVDRFNYADFDFSESGDELSDNVRDLTHSMEFPASRSRKNKERRAERKMRRFLDVESTGVVVKSSMGSRRQRRLESVRILMSFADKDDICTDFSDLVPHTVSAFERLFLDEKSMQMWNDFIERDEEEQRQILEEGELKSSDGCGWFVVGGKPGTSKSPKSLDVDGRKHHPAYYGKACFDRMSSRSKRLLSEKRLPWGFIDQLEGELLSFFCSTSPDSGKDDAVYVGVFENSLERALAHAVAQFLMLKSKSISVRGSGERLTEFRNPRAFYIPPHVRLVPYLSSIRSEPIEVPQHSKLKDNSSDREQSADSSFSEVDPENIDL